MSSIGLGTEKIQIIKHYHRPDHPRAWQRCPLGENLLYGYKVAAWLSLYDIQRLRESLEARGGGKEDVEIRIGDHGGQERSLSL